MNTCRNCYHWNNGVCLRNGGISHGDFSCGAWQQRGPSDADQIARLTAERDAARRELAELRSRLGIRGPSRLP